MIVSKLIVIASLITIVTVGAGNTASAVGTRSIQPKALAALTESHYPAWQDAHVEAKGEPEKPVEVVEPAPAPPAPAPVQEVPAPAPEPVVEPPLVQPAPIQAGPNCELARSLINQYSWNHDVAYNVMVQESGCNPMAANWNDQHGSCVGSFGLFQINCGNGQLYDPAANVARAFAMWQQSGWQPWSSTTCKKVACY